MVYSGGNGDGSSSTSENFGLGGAWVNKFGANQYRAIKKPKSFGIEYNLW